jgi:site-specific recombinase XerD
VKLDAGLESYFFSKELSRRTREWYEAKIGTFITWVEGHTCRVHEMPALQIEQLETTHLREFFTVLRENPSTAINHQGRPPTDSTIHGYARALKAWLNWCVREGWVDERVIRRLEMPKQEKHIIEVFTRQQIEQLFRACKRRYDYHYSWLAERDKTIIVLLLDTGIRASELCGLTIDDVRLGVEDAYIVVNGKGRKQRECPLGRGARQQMHTYLYRWRPSSKDNHFFLTRAARQLGTEGLSAMLFELKRKTDITGVRCSPHDFRHTFAFNFMAQGGDVLKLSRLLGHTDLGVTAEYLQAFSSRDARRGYVSVADTFLGN